MNEELDHLNSHIIQQNVRLIEARDKLKAFTEAVQVSMADSHDMMEQYDIRAERLYSQLLDANAAIQRSTEIIADAAGYGVEQLRGNMENVTKQAGTVVDVMMALQRAVDGEKGLTQQVKSIENAFGEKVWILDKSINALSTTQVSKLAQHEKALASLKTIIVAALAFCAGVGVTSNAYLGAIGIGILGVGVAMGMAFAWLFNKKEASK
jgi:hypothetical protein